MQREAAFGPRPPTHELTALNREQRRRIGLSTAGLVELFDQARDQAYGEGCTCGVTRITPTPTKTGHHFNVLVNHALGCPLHPLMRARARRTLRYRLRALLRRRRPE